MAYDFSRLRILVVDDNVFMRRLLRDLLRSVSVKNENIREAFDGDSGLTAMRVGSTDLIISDLNMDPVDGTTLIRNIRWSEGGWDQFVPIIVCTGHSESRHILGARDAGATEILRKPFTAKSLYHRIQVIIEKPRPFIRTDDFIGPDRRRQDLPFKGEDRRKSSDIDI